MWPPDALQAAGDALALPHGDCYWVWPGRFLAGSHPDSCLAALLEAGVDAFVDLTCNQRALARYTATLPAHARWHGFAIVDYAVPGVAQMRDIVETIDAELERGARLYLHCHAGVGRTGTALGCWLVEQGQSGPGALPVIERKRRGLARLAMMPRSPETERQRTFVLNWAAGAARP